ncbi:MAG: Bax inhibitor-1/YccA family protein [Muribaculaceae bacterium]|nr:Bax inhibitor-1/YccA family protein [Muribaculaceae bacterium]
MNNYYQNAYDAQALDMHVSRVMKNVYVRMFLALLVTALTAWFVPSIPGIGELVLSRGGYLTLVIVEVGLVIGISAGINKLSSVVATLLFFLFAIVNGATLSIIFMAFSPESIMKTFLITAGTFGAMSIYGYFTNKDLTRIGSFLFMALIGLIICTVVNFFMHSDGLGWIISFAGVVIFLGLTAWDTQKIKTMAMQMPDATDGRLATIGALSLYLDFINLFIYLLRFFGSSRD